MEQKSYDFIIAGAGPVGLAAAITAARLGASCIVLEKAEKAGPIPRGESIANYPFMDQLLGGDWLKDHALTDPAYRRFHSPWDKKSTLIDCHRPYYFFRWRTLIDHMTSLAGDAGARIVFNAEVTGLIESGGACSGVQYRDKNGIVREIRGTTVLGCLGHQDSLGVRFGIDRKQIDCPTIKYLSDNAPAVKIQDYPYLQFYMIPSGYLPCAPHLPPAVAYVFPLKDGEMEAGLMLRLSTFSSLKSVELPDEQLMYTAWEYLTREYPGFSRFFQGAVASYQKLTVISNRRLFENVIPHPEGGLIFTGDTVGFSEANGSSGLYFGMAQADFWVRTIHAAGITGNGSWSSRNVRDLLAKYHEWEIYKYIRRGYKEIASAEKMMFKTLGTGAAINRMWGLIMTMLQWKT